jgi:hypothetical protein
MARLFRALKARAALASDAGMSTAEYCIGTVAACAFAAILYEVISGNWVTVIVKNLISHALHLVKF